MNSKPYLELGPMSHSPTRMDNTVTPETNINKQEGCQLISGVLNPVIKLLRGNRNISFFQRVKKTYNVVWEVTMSIQKAKTWQTKVKKTIQFKFQYRIGEKENSFTEAKVRCHFKEQDEVTMQAYLLEIKHRLYTKRRVPPKICVCMYVCVFYIQIHTNICLLKWK